MMWSHWYQKGLFGRILMTKFFYVPWIMIFSLSLLFNENNNLKAHFSNLSSPWGKLRLKKIYSNFLMITCKMTCVIQGILPSNYFHNVNLSNYGLAHVLKNVTP
jgi:hypothetical protein